MVKYSDELYHFGRSKRDGAKVGSGRYPLGSGERPRSVFRKAGEAVVSPRKSHKKREKQQVHEANKPTYKSMTDDELREAINRANLEKQYKEVLITPYRKKTGKEVVIGYLKKGADAAASDLTVKAGKAIVSYALKKTLDPEIYKQLYAKK